MMVLLCQKLLFVWWLLGCKTPLWMKSCVYKDPIRLLKCNFPLTTWCCPSICKTKGSSRECCCCSCVEVRLLLYAATLALVNLSLLLLRCDTTTTANVTTTTITITATATPRTGGDVTVFRILEVEVVGSYNNSNL